LELLFQTFKNVLLTQPNTVYDEGMVKLHRKYSVLSTQNRLKESTIWASEGGCILNTNLSIPKKLGGLARPIPYVISWVLPQIKRNGRPFHNHGSPIASCPLFNNIRMAEKTQNKLLAQKKFSNPPEYWWF